MNHNRKAKLLRQQEHSQLRNEAISLRCTLDELYNRFDSLTDPVQLDACIFEMNAVMARYDYTIKCLKAFDIT